MPKIQDIASPKAKDLAQYIGKKYGNGNDVIAATEVSRALKAIAVDPELAARMKDVFGTNVPNAPKALITALYGNQPPPPAAGGIPAGSRPGGPGAITLQPNGALTLGSAPANPDPIKNAAVLYEGALLIPTGVNPYAKATPEVRAKAYGILTQSASIGAERSIREMQPSETTMQLKSGSASLLLELAKAANTPGEAQLRGRAIDTYLTLAEKEIHRGLKVSMTLNLDKSQTELGALTPEQKTRLGALLEKALPTKPPYEDWFKNGNNQLNIKQYVHSDYWNLHGIAYQQRGFKRTDLPDGRVLWEGTVKDPTGRNPETKFRIEVAKVADYSTDRKMLQDMNDPNTQIEIYTGHSNLGGNIAAALKAAPQTEVGEKLTYLWMCRGKQNVADFTNRFPNSHLITTDVPPDGYSLVPMLGALVDNIAKRESYAAVGKQGDQPGYHLFPHDRRLYDHRDLDKDGKLDGAGDKVFDIYPRAPHGKSIDLKPGASVDPAKLDGGAVVNALGFANTLLHYHVDYGDGRSPITAKYGDHFHPKGWYQSEGTELLRITPKEVNGETFYDVEVNSKYANQSEEALGVAALYELSKYSSQQTKGREPLTVEDKLRNLLLASEYLAYMAGPGQMSEEIIRNLMKANNWPSTFGLPQLNAALEKDGHGYASMDAVNALKAAVGSQLGDANQIT